MHYEFNLVSSSAVLSVQGGLGWPVPCCAGHLPGIAYGLRAVRPGVSRAARRAERERGGR